MRKLFIFILISSALLRAEDLTEMTNFIPPQTIADGYLQQNLGGENFAADATSDNLLDSVEGNDDFSLVGKGGGSLYTEDAFNLGTSKDTVGDNFFLSNQTAAFESSLASDFLKAEAPVEEEVFNPNPSATNEKTTEDTLSSRGLPKVSSASTTLDILGLPKPQMVESDPLDSSLNPTVEARQEERKEKVKGRVRALFENTESY